MPLTLTEVILCCYQAENTNVNTVYASDTDWGYNNRYQLDNTNVNTVYASDTDWGDNHHYQLDNTNVYTVCLWPWLRWYF